MKQLAMITFVISNPVAVVIVGSIKTHFVSLTKVVSLVYSSFVKCSKTLKSQKLVTIKILKIVLAFSPYIKCM